MLSRLNYCNAILAELPSVTLAPLQRVQNAAARLVLGLRYTDHITPALIKLHWLPVRQRISYKLCMLVHKSLAGQAPSYLSELCHLVSENPFRAVLRSADSRDLIIPQTELCIGDRAFSVAGAREWNRLPTELKTTLDTQLFKCQLKTYYFRIAFDITAERWHSTLCTAGHGFSGLL